MDLFLLMYHHGYYHNVSNVANHVRWKEEQLISILTEHSAIVVDNCAYHLVYSVDTPIPSKMKSNSVLIIYRPKIKHSRVRRQQ